MSLDKFPELSKKLHDTMKAKNYSPTTIKDKTFALKQFLTNGFTKLMDNINAIDDKKKQAVRYNKLAALFRLLPELKPEPKLFEAFTKKQTELNKIRNTKMAEEHTSKVPNELPKLDKIKDDLRTLVRRFKRKKSPNDEIKATIELLLATLYTELDDYIPRSEDILNLRLSKPKDKETASKSNYIYGKNMLLNIFKKNKRITKDGDAEQVRQYKTIKVPLPKEIKSLATRLKKIDPSRIYIFGGEKAMNNIAFNRLQKKILGLSTNALRKQLIQHKFGVKREDIEHREQVAKKAGHTLSTQRNFYS